MLFRNWYQRPIWQQGPLRGYGTAVIIVLAALYQLFVSVDDALDLVALEHYGHPALARVVDRQIGLHHHRYSPASTIYKLTLSFRTQEGRAVSGEIEVSQPDYEATRRGGRVDILYLANRPATFTLRSETGLTWPVLARMGGSILLIGFGALVAHLTRRHVERQATPALSRT